MKTEQEQIKAIKQIIDERVETTLGQVQGRHGNVIKTVDTVIIARDIVDAGYGDVSEYKAEIEQLKDNHAKLQELFAKYQLASDKEIRAQVKQAKIDVLNFLKDGYEVDISTSNDCDMVVRVDDIDELINEVENEN